MWCVLLPHTSPPLSPNKTAALLTLLLRSDFEAEAALTPGAIPRRIHGYAYAPPPIVDEVKCALL